MDPPAAAAAGGAVATVVNAAGAVPGTAAGATAAAGAAPGTAAAAGAVHMEPYLHQAAAHTPDAKQALKRRAHNGRTKQVSTSVSVSRALQPHTDRTNPTGKQENIVLKHNLQDNAFPWPSTRWNELS